MSLKYFVTTALACIQVVPVIAAEHVRDSLFCESWQEETVSAWNKATSSKSIFGDELEKKTAGSLHQMLMGAIPSLHLNMLSGNPNMNNMMNNPYLRNSQFGVNARGFSDVVVLVDNIPVPINQLQLMPSQIESITPLFDVLDKAKYGPIASYGAISIKTKKGGYDQPLKISVDFEGGISSVANIPEWSNGLEYVRFNNLAREAAKYTTLYSEEAIKGFEMNDPYHPQYPNVDWKSLMMKDIVQVGKFAFNAYGGSKTVKYNVFLGATNNGMIIDSPYKNDYSRINLSTNIATHIGRWIEASVGVNSMISFGREPNIEWNSWQNYPGVAFPMDLGTNELTGLTIYPTTNTFKGNPYGQLMEGGFQSQKYRTIMATAALDVDFGWFLSGLKSKSFFSMNSSMGTRQTLKDDYLAFYWTPEEGAGLPSTEHKGAKASAKSMSATATYTGISFYEHLSYEWEKYGHNLAANATFFISKNATTSNNQFEKQLYTIGNIKYNYKNRYFLDAVTQYAGSVRLKGKNRFDYFPAVGISWVPTNEKFMSGARKVLNNLKIYGQVGNIGAADIYGTPYLYQAEYAMSSGMYFGPQSAFQWFGSAQNKDANVYQTTIKRLANPDIEWAKIYQVDLGVEMRLLNCLELGVQLYKTRRYDIITDVTLYIPKLYGFNNVVVYDNHNARLTEGIDLSLAYDRKFGDFGIRVSGFTSTNSTTYSRLLDDSYYNVGLPVDIYRGLICIGKFTTEEQLTTLPKYSSSVQIGDLMYEDINNDKTIDRNDYRVIGHLNPRLRYAVNLNLSWKSLSVSMSGTGAAIVDLPLTSNYFWSGWGDGNYSRFVMDNIGGAYPSLSYQKNTNTFVPSTFWLVDGSYFKLRDVTIEYNCNINKSGIQNIKFSLRGSNLFTLTGVKYVDPENIDAGVGTYPMMRTVTLGVKMNF